MSTSIANAIQAFFPASLQRPERDTVSVIIPCYNEEKFIGKALANLVYQYDAEDYEIVIVDGMSEDRTRDIVWQFRRMHPEITVSIVDNPARTIPQALNLGISIARGAIIARIDAHAAPSPGYIRRCVAVLKAGDAAIVGMPCRVQPGSPTLTGRSIATAVSHPFGIGDAKYRLAPTGNDAGQLDVDTVAFACFHKSLWMAIGGYDERLLTNEDYDFNYRVRQTGRRVVLDRAEHCDYFARATLKSLAAQYLRYGFWKAQMVKRQPASLKLRHAIAPAFVASLLILSALGFLTTTAWDALLVALSAYSLAAIIFALHATRQRHETLLMMLALPFVFFTIHISWGTSFLIGLVYPSSRG